MGRAVAPKAWSVFLQVSSPPTRREDAEHLDQGAFTYFSNVSLIAMSDFLLEEEAEAVTATFRTIDPLKPVKPACSEPIATNDEVEAAIRGIGRLRNTKCKVQRGFEIVAGIKLFFSHCNHRPRGSVLPQRQHVHDAQSWFQSEFHLCPVESIFDVGRLPLRIGQKIVAELREIRAAGLLNS